MIYIVKGLVLTVIVNEAGVFLEPHCFLFGKDILNLSTCKGERERYIQLNAEFQRIARRDKKAFLNEQCKVTERNNRMIKTRHLFKKMGDIKGTFHARMGTIKDRNGKGLTKTEEIKKRRQEYTEELYKRSLNDLDSHSGVVTHLEPDILEGVNVS